MPDQVRHDEVSLFNCRVNIIDESNLDQQTENSERVWLPMIVAGGFLNFINQI